MKDLEYKKESFYDKFGKKGLSDAFKYANDYKSFLNVAKTERESVKYAISEAKKNGFIEYKFGYELKKGGKYYYNNRGKNIFLFKIGNAPIKEGFRIAAAHIDSPRIDLKQCPLYDDGEMGFFKTHYYGGIRKYQWLTIPLSLHGVIVKKDSSVIDVVIGEDDNDPIFYINDLLPHLSQDDDKKPLGNAVPAEKLNILIGSIPFSDKDKKSIKFNILNILNQKYGIEESDFLSAELSVVPAFKARDIGFDRSLIGAYGHDDKVCAYPALCAFFDSLDTENSTMCILVDKEETGSDGNTGMQADLFTDLIGDISTFLHANQYEVRANSKCLSADVSAAYDPNFSDVFEKSNSSLLSHGTILMKYTGARGKSGTSDASAEYIAWLREVMDKNDILWQTGELGKVDIGGGGTVAKYIAKHNIDTIDLGVPVISMHAPYEVVSKVDVYETYRAFGAFFKN